jgi:fructokinase
MTDVLVIGEALVDFVPTHRGPLHESRGFELHTGGAPANVAIGCARLGARSAFIGVVGDDAFGRFLADGLGREGVDVSGMRLTFEDRTGLCFITLDPSGERSFTHRGGSPETLLSAPDVDVPVVAQARALQFSAGSLRKASGEAAIHRAIDQCTGIVCCDPGTTPRHWVDPVVLAARLERVLKRCNVVKCSSDEVAELTGESDPLEGARVLVARGAELAVVTLGPHGALWQRADDGGHVPSPPVEVVDTTGAGDAFMAALLVRLSAEKQRPSQLPAQLLQDHVRFACEIGAYAVTALGAVAGVPRIGVPNSLG